MSIKENIPLNFELLKSPENWIIIGLMLTIPLLGLSLIFHNETPTDN